MPGWDVRALDAEGEEVEAGEIGALVVRLPLPPGTFPTLWNAEERFIDALSRVKGAFSIVLLTDEVLIAARDPSAGARPPDRTGRSGVRG